MILYIFALLLVAIPISPPDGTAIFLTQIGKPNLVAKEIEKTTGENIVHVAIILYEERDPYVYESTVPGGVQRTKLNAYYERIHWRQAKHPEQGIQMQLIPPRPAYTDNELQKMKTYANSQLGRRYMVRGYWKEKEVRGMHCSQYVGNIIGQTRRIVSENYKETPVGLYMKLWRLEQRDQRIDGIGVPSQ